MRWVEAVCVDGVCVMRMGETVCGSSELTRPFIFIHDHIIVLASTAWCF